MVNFLLGFWLADLLFALILYFKKEIILGLNQGVIFFSIAVDILLLVLLLFIKYAQKRSRKS
jgi:hypothetical protein